MQEVGFFLERIDAFSLCFNMIILPLHDYYYLNSDGVN